MAGVGTAAAEMQQEVAKPLCDRRSYQHAVLHNGLRVLAVQDKDAVFAAACANVQVRPLLTQRQDLDFWLYPTPLCVIRTSAMAAGWLL
jgi:hypothetical protein